MKNIDVLFKEKGNNIRVIFESEKAKDFVYTQIPNSEIVLYRNKPSVIINGGVENVNNMIALLTSHNLKSKK